jgi:hypothetical protein
MIERESVVGDLHAARDQQVQLLDVTFPWFGIGHREGRPLDKLLVMYWFFL